MKWCLLMNFALRFYFALSRHFDCRVMFFSCLFLLFLRSCCWDFFVFSQSLYFVLLTLSLLERFYLSLSRELKDVFNISWVNVFWLRVYLVMLSQFLDVVSSLRRTRQLQTLFCFDSLWQEIAFVVNVVETTLSFLSWKHLSSNQMRTCACVIVEEHIAASWCKTLYVEIISWKIEDDLMKRLLIFDRISKFEYHDLNETSIIVVINELTEFIYLLTMLRIYRILSYEFHEFVHDTL